MKGSTHGSTRPFSSARATTSTTANRLTTCAVRSPDQRAAGRQPGPVVRQRVHSPDAILVRSRVEARADELGLRCGTRRVLSAVLALTVGYNRLHDDLVRIHHIAARFPAGTRLVTPTTIGRLLTKLDELNLITYRPARGRGGHASIAIYPKFCEGVTEYTPARKRRPAENPGVERRSRGPKSAEIIDFSKRGFLIGDLSPKTTPADDAHGGAETVLGPRPTAVDVAPNTAKAVLAAVPDAYTQAPGRIRSCIGALIEQYLRRGWRAEDIIETLGKPLPEGGVRAPLMLARYRLAKNMIGAGPGLAPIQRRWEERQLAAERARYEAELSASYRSVVETIGEQLSQQVFDAVWTGPGRASDVDRHRAVVHGARMARHRHPGCGVVAAVLAWLPGQATSPIRSRPAAAPSSQSTNSAGGSRSPMTLGELMAATPAGRCVGCGSIDAQPREDLPLPTPVCEACYQAASTPYPDIDNSPAPQHEHDYIDHRVAG